MAFLWNAAKNIATAATGVLMPGVASTSANLEGEAGAGSEAGDESGEAEEEEKGEQAGGASSEPQKPAPQSRGRDFLASQKRALKLTDEDAIQYLTRVKAEFGEDTYAEFLDLMAKYLQSHDAPTTGARLYDMFRGSPELLLGFNDFLPTGYKIEITDMKKCGGGDDVDDNDDNDEYTSAGGSFRETSNGSPGFHGACPACAADDAAVQRGALEGCQKCRPVWITAEEYEKDALVAMERAGETVASVAAEEWEQQQQQQRQPYCDYHQGAAALGVTKVPEKEEEGESGGGGSGPTGADAHAHAQARSQPAAIAADTGEAEGDDDDDKNGKERELIGSPAPGETGSRRHAILTTRLPPDEETKGGDTGEGPHGPVEQPELQPAEVVEAGPVRGIVSEACRFPRLGEAAAAHPGVVGAPRDDAPPPRFVPPAPLFSEKPQQPSDHKHEHELDTARQGLDDTTIAPPGQEGREGDLEASASSTSSPAGEKPEIGEPLTAEEIQLLMDCWASYPQEPQTKGQEAEDAAVVQPVPAGANVLIPPGGDDDITSRLKEDLPKTDGRQELARLPESYRHLGSAAPPPSPISERLQREWDDKSQRRRPAQAAERDDTAREEKRRPPLPQSPLATPPSRSASAVGGDVKEQGMKGPRGGGEGHDAGQATTDAKKTPVEAMTAAVRQGATADPAAAGAGAAAPAHEETARVDVDVGTGAEGCANLETRERGGGEGTTVGREAKTPQEERVGPAEEGGKEGDGGTRDHNNKKTFLSRAERRAAERERAREKAKTARAVRLEQHLRSQKKNNSKRIEGQLLAGAPAAAAEAAAAPPEAKTAHPPAAKTKTKQWKKPPQGSVVAKQAPGNGGGGGGGGGDGGGGRGGDGGATLDGKLAAKGEGVVDKGCAAAGSTANLHPAADTAADTAAATAGRSPVNGDPAVNKRAAGSSAVSSVARPSPVAAAAVAAEPAVPAAERTARDPSSGAAKSITFADPVTGSSDRAPTRASGTASGTANKKPSVADHLDATSASVKQIDAIAKKAAGGDVNNLAETCFASSKKASYPGGGAAGTPPPPPPTSVDDPRDRARAARKEANGAMESILEMCLALSRASSPGGTTSTQPPPPPPPTTTVGDNRDSVDSVMEKIGDDMTSIAEAYLAYASASSSGRKTSTPPQPPPTVGHNRMASTAMKGVGDIMRSLAESFFAFASSSGGAARTKPPPAATVDDCRDKADALIKEADAAMQILAGVEAYFASAYFASASASASASSLGRTAGTPPPTSADDNRNNVDAAIKKATAGAHRLVLAVKSLAEASSAFASTSSLGRTGRTPPPPPLPPPPSAHDPRDNAGTPADVAAASRGPLSGPVDSFVLPEGEGWTWPVVDTNPGGGGSGVAVAVGGDGGGRAGDGGVRCPKGDGEGEGGAGEVAVPKPRRRVAWIGRPETVGGKVQHPWGNWKTWRQPQKWEKTVATALTRYSKLSAALDAVTFSERQEIVEIFKSLKGDNLARAGKIYGLRAPLGGSASAQELALKVATMDLATVRAFRSRAFFI